MSVAHTTNGPERTSEHEPERRPLDAVVRWLRRSWVPLLLVAASLLVGGVVTASHTKAFSPYDEWVYYDYVTKIPTQFVVREGETIGPAALEAMSCNGDTFGPRGDPCGGPYDDPSLYPQAGKTSADLYTPFYFAVTWGIAKGIQFFTSADLLTAARYSSLLWLSAGVWVFAAALRKLRVPQIVILGLGLLVIAAPSTSYSNTYISTDAPAFLIGSLLLLFTIRFIRGEMSGWWLLIPATLGILLKVANIVGIGAAFLVLVIYALSHWKRPPPPGAPSRAKLIAIAIVMVIVPLIAEFAWLGIRSALRVGHQPNQGLNGAISVRSLSAQVTTFFSGPFGNPNNSLGIPVAVFVPIGWLLIAGVVAYLFAARQWDIQRSISVATACGAVVFAPVLLIAMTITLGSAAPVVDRYAISLVPFMLVCLAGILRNRIGRWGTLGYSCALCVVIIFYAVRLTIINA